MPVPVRVAGVARTAPLATPPPARNAAPLRLNSLARDAVRAAAARSGATAPADVAPAAPPSTPDQAPATPPPTASPDEGNIAVVDQAAGEAKPTPRSPSSGGGPKPVLVASLIGALIAAAGVWTDVRRR